MSSSTPVFAYDKPPLIVLSSATTPKEVAAYLLAVQTKCAPEEVYTLQSDFAKLFFNHPDVSYETKVACYFPEHPSVSSKKRNYNWFFSILFWPGAEAEEWAWANLRQSELMWLIEDSDTVGFLDEEKNHPNGHPIINLAKNPHYNTEILLRVCDLILEGIMLDEDILIWKKADLLEGRMESVADGTYSISLFRQLMSATPDNVITDDVLRLLNRLLNNRQKGLALFLEIARRVNPHMSDWLDSWVFHLYQQTD